MKTNAQKLHELIREGIVPSKELISRCIKFPYKHKSGLTICHCNSAVMAAGIGIPCKRWGTDRACKGCNFETIYKRYPNVKKCYDENLSCLERSLDNLYYAVSDYCEKHHPKYFRTRYSGDVESLREFDIWVKLAYEYPDTVFYCYTKSNAGSEASFKTWYSMPNLVIIARLPGCNVLGTLENYADLETCLKLERCGKAMVCPKTKPDKPEGFLCGVHCNRCMKHPVHLPLIFVKHK